ncbi:helix-turn-helix domain-containing protein [Paenibacillus glucanolyticus]|uniref:helix-turn-helix domain-containing protein n=1 Tax=Paenibacillus glucanolyticus TaxID=59843 RepID=UPI00096DE808|nr:AraC family transcriptional regulator [Paenibacillus glucanolyticus]OMF66074.1 AraC family transcriptional regulator [Paenibacillus glucanolyticus]
MIKLMSVNFDDGIPNWRTQLETIEYNVLVVVREGKVRYELNGEEMIAEKDDVLFIPQSTRRSGTNWNGLPHQKHTILFTTDRHEPTGIPFLDEGKCLKFNLSHIQYAHHRCERLYEEMRGDKSYRTMICLGIMQELIGMLARELEKTELAPSKRKYADTIKSYLLEHYRDPIEIESLAKLIHRSPSYATALFKEVHGHSPIRYMHQLRVLEACSLLLHSDMTIANIAQYLGYYDTSYFYRIFKKYTGLSPSDYVLQGERPDISKLFT